MKKSLTLLSMLFMAFIAFGQVPGAFNYQAVIRNTAGEVIANANVSFRISILQESETGSSVYVETQRIATNGFGLVNLKIGKGTKVSGNFTPDNWGNSSHFIKVEVDPAGGSTYALLGTTELLSVPYAFHAQTVENDQVNDADADATNEIQALSINGTQLTLSKNGGTVTLPSSGGTVGDNWGTQTVVSDATLDGAGTIASPLSVVGDLTDNQTLSISGNDLSIVGGNTVTLPSGSVSPWTISGSNIYRSTGFVGIGTATPTDRLHVAGNVLLNDNGSYKINWGSGYCETRADEASMQFISKLGGGMRFYNSATVNGDALLSMAISNEGKVCIGSFTPNQNGILTIHGQNASAFMSFNNNTTGNTLNDGLTIGAASSVAYVYNFENTPLKFATNNAIRMTLTANGYAGFGTESPGAGLHLKGTGFPSAFMYIQSDAGQDAGFRLYEGTAAQWHIFNNSAAGGLQIYNAGAKTAIFAKQSNSFVGIGTTSPTQALHVVGNAYKTEGGTSWATSSDIRLKNLTGTYNKGLDEIMQLKPVRYIYKKENPRQLNSETEQVGFVAQEVQKVFPEAVSVGEDGYLDFNIHPINIAFVNAVKELKSENDALKSKVDKLESRLEQLETLMEASAKK